jgi:hypothetical protein
MNARLVPPASAIPPHLNALRASPRKRRPRSLTVKAHSTAHPRQPVSRSPPACLPSVSSSPWARASTRYARPQVRPTSHSCPGNPRLEPCVPHVRKEPGTRGKARETIPVSFLRASPIPRSSKTKRCAPEFLRREKRRSKTVFAFRLATGPNLRVLRATRRDTGFRLRQKKGQYHERT